MNVAVGGFRQLRSAVDASVNFSKPHADGGLVETRFVQRVPERFIVYVSSMTGCDKACRFCHLTQTGQTTATFLTADEMLEQAETVLSEGVPPGARTVHFNFMARGEPMSNPWVNKALFRDLATAAARCGLKARIKLSSIFPTDFKPIDPQTLSDEAAPPVDFYYSLYSLDPAWRRRWIPKAAAPEKAFAWLREFQRTTGNRIILHWALIEGENDSLADARAAAEMAKEAGLFFDFNLVRYNPANGKSREASPERRAAYVREMEGRVGVQGRVKVIPRVGMDVAASCGMFLTSGKGGSAMSNTEVSAHGN